MSRAFKYCFVSGFLLTLSSPSWASPQSANIAEPSSKITVRLYNYAGVPRGRLARAQRHATTIFQKAGLEQTWLDCRLSGQEPIKDAACEQPLGPKDVVLRILPRRMAARFGVNNLVCGLALPARNRGFGVASIFAHRVDELVSQGSFSVDANSARALILGHVMAHEIGHLLLGKRSHAGKGVMKFPWNRKALKNASFGALVFTAWQTKRIHAQVLARIPGTQARQMAKAVP